MSIAISGSGEADFSWSHVAQSGLFEANPMQVFSDIRSGTDQSNAANWFQRGIDELPDEAVLILDQRYMAAGNAKLSLEQIKSITLNGIRAVTAKRLEQESLNLSRVSWLLGYGEYFDKKQKSLAGDRKQTIAKEIDDDPTPTDAKLILPELEFLKRQGSFIADYNRFASSISTVHGLITALALVASEGGRLSSKGHTLKHTHDKHDFKKVSLELGGNRMYSLWGKAKGVDEIEETLPQILGQSVNISKLIVFDYDDPRTPQKCSFTPGVINPDGIFYHGHTQKRRALFNATVETPNGEQEVRVYKQSEAAICMPYTDRDLRLGLRDAWTIDSGILKGGTEEQKAELKRTGGQSAPIAKEIFQRAINEKNIQLRSGKFDEAKAGLAVLPLGSHVIASAFLPIAA